MHLLPVCAAMHILPHIKVPLSGSLNWQSPILVAKSEVEKPRKQRAKRENEDYANDSLQSLPTSYFLLTQATQLTTDGRHLTRG